MRLFIAAEFSEEVKNELYSLKNKFPNNLAKISWISKRNLHLTLKFLGETKLGIEEISSRLENIKFKSFNVVLGKFGVFPNLDNINILWVDIEPMDKVIELQQKIDSELLGIFNKDQKFSPHITLGRVKIIKNKNELINNLKRIKIEPKLFNINHFNLMQSKLTKDGSMYSIIKKFEA